MYDGKSPNPEAQREIELWIWLFAKVVYRREVLREAGLLSLMIDYCLSGSGTLGLGVKVEGS